MIVRTTLRFRLAALTLVGSIAMLGAVASGCSSDEGGLDKVGCESTKQYFAENAWRIVEQKCIGCHNPQGQARDTNYILKGPAEAGFLDHNIDVIADLVAFEKDGKPLFLLKPTGQIEHKGGVLIEQGSEDYKTLVGLVTRLKDESTCAPNIVNSFTGVEMLSPRATLRKAALMLASRAPSAAEYQRVEEGGFSEVESILDELMTEEAFYTQLKVMYNDLFGTDFYLDGASDQLMDGPYAYPMWYETADKSLLSQYGLASTGDLERFTDVSLAREPLELIAHVVREGRPFTEILTADYMMVTPLSARSFGVQDEVTFKSASDPLEFAEARLPDFPPSGVLTSWVLWTVHNTTPTNRNRHRSRMIWYWFLGTDILRTATQPIDQTASNLINPTRDDPNCVVCHAQIDPIGGTLAAILEDGEWTAEPTWYPEMFPPGFGNETLSSTGLKTGTTWVAARIAKDDRFALAAVYNMYRGLSGQEPLVAPSDYEDEMYQAKFKSFLMQANTFRAIADKFIESDYDLKLVVKELVLSPYFRAKNAVDVTDAQAVALGEVGMGHLLTPVQLHHKIKAVLGTSWLAADGRPNLAADPRDLTRLGQFQLYYGGVNSVDVLKRITDPNGLMASVAQRMAVQMACKAVPADFARDDDKRKLFPLVELGGEEHDPLALEPETEGGLPIALAQDGIKEIIVHLHQHVLGEIYTVEHPEVERTYQLFVETWKEGNAALAYEQPEDDEEPEYEPTSADLPNNCRALADPSTSIPYDEDGQLVSDDKYVVRSWMAVLTYMLSDYRFLYE